MAYRLQKPYTDNQRIDFTVKYNHEMRLLIEEGVDALYALEANEIMKDGLPFVDPEYENKIAQAEAERIAMLSLTAADVQRAIYKAKGMDFDDIIAFISLNPPQGIDIKALKIELSANNFYRGNPYVTAVGNLLGFSKEQLDCFFQTNDYTCLLSPQYDSSEEPTEQEPTEPEGTEPEGNEPENTEEETTEPQEPTEAEPTEPETSEPETTEPETTEPEEPIEEEPIEEEPIGDPMIDDEEE